MSYYRSKPTVSICLPTFNGVNYLNECLESALGQTMTDTEILVVDDASSDETVAIAMEYAQRDRRVRVHVNQKNLGLVANWNHSVKLAQGEWIKFLFQDDLIAPNCVERLVNLGTAAKMPLVTCKRDFIFEGDVRREMREFFLKNADDIDDVFHVSDKLSAREFQALMLNRIAVNLIGEPTTVLLHRSVFSRFGYFNPMLIAIPDVEYWSRVGIHNGVLYTPEPLAGFRFHGASTSAANYGKRTYRIELDVIILLYEYAFNPLYRPLRDAASQQRPRIDFLALLKDRAQKARSAAEDAMANSAKQDPVTSQDWRMIVAHYPKLEGISRPSWNMPRLLRAFFGSA